MSIDMPANGAVVRQPFAIGGWASDLAASDNGIDVVHVYAYPATGAPPVFLGAPLVNGARPDVGAAFGSRHTASGYGLIGRGLAPGGYTLVVYAHSNAGAGFVMARATAIRVDVSAVLMLDAPRTNAIVGQGFLIGGWAADFGARAGGGIDLVHIYAYPLGPSGQLGAPVFLGQALVNGHRPDVGAAFGAQFGTAGFGLAAPALAPGRYRIVAYGRSLVVGTFAVATAADITLR
jgi:hypothetical protein